MLTLFIFNRLAPNRKLAYLQKKGIFVGSRIRDNKTISVYMLSDSFVEVTITNTNRDVPESIQVFRSLEKLQSYLADDARINTPTT